MHEALERAMAELCLGPAMDIQDAAVMEAWLERNAVTAADRAELRTQADRLLVYRELVRETLRGALSAALPRTMARLGPQFDEYFARFLAERGPRTHYLRDVTDELLAFAAPLWRADPRLPPWALDLAEHEAVQIRVAAQAPRRGGEGPGAELALDRPLRWVEAKALEHYRYAVHELSEDPEDRSEPKARDTYLLVYRSPEHELRFLELSELAHAILGRLFGGEALGPALRGACAERGQPLDSTVLEGTAKLLHDLAERGVLVGAAPEGGNEHGG